MSLKKRVLKIGLMLIGLIIALVLIFIIYVQSSLPRVSDAPDLEVPMDDESIQRGEYLANHVMICMDCHSKRDWNRYTGPPLSATLGQGGELFDQTMGFPGKYVSSNITPFNLKDWTDGEIYRAITSGVSKDGRALFPIMPYPNYAKMDKEDIYDVIAYVRSLEPIEITNEESYSDFPMNLIIKFIPGDPEHSQKPDKNDQVAYGKYMLNAAGCYNCHTKEDKGEYVGPDLAGGMEIKFPNGNILRSPNITPHESGIGNWSEKKFISRFRSYADSVYQSPEISDDEMQTIMPWTMYADMKDEDLKAIYAYLQTVEPIENEIVKFSPAK